MTHTVLGAEPVLEAQTELGEGPVWDSYLACLYFVDILRGEVHRFDPANDARRVYSIGQPVGSVAPTERGDLVLAVRDGFARLDLLTGRTTMMALVEADRADQRMNDGKCDPAGRFWAGTMAFDEHADAGALYCLGVDGLATLVLDRVTISNGLDWSDDGRRMYFIDSPRQAVEVFDFDATNGSIANRRTFVRLPPDHGTPDGLTLDSAGGVWVALWGGAAVHRYAPDGSLDTIVRLPTTYPTSCAFGGVEMRDLYITSATIKLSQDERAAQPLAGALFRCRPGPAGRPACRYRG